MRHSHPSLPRPRRYVPPQARIGVVAEHVTPSRLPINDLAALVAGLRAQGMPERDIPKVIENVRNRRATTDIAEAMAPTRYPRS